MSLPLAAGITAVWMLLVFFIQQGHELWLDEAHSWLLAKDSRSFGEFMVNIRYEGHPPLWGVLLFCASRISGSYQTMQLLHLCFAGGSIFLILRYAPFSTWVKMLLPFTYFFGFEYAVISRNYAGAVFFLLLACVQLCSANRNYLRIALVLGIATLFHLYSGIVAVALFLYCALLEKERGVSLRTLVAPWITFAVFCGVAVYFAKTPPDHFFYSLHSDGIFSVNRIGTVVALPFTALLHFPDLLSDNWWNTNLFFPENRVAAGILALVIACVPLFIFSSDKRVLLLYVSGLLLLSVAMLITPMPLSVRHAGFTGVLFFICLWMMKASGTTVFTRPKQLVLCVILVVQVAAFVVTGIYETKRNFSSSKAAAAWIETNYPEATVAVYPQYSGPALSCYLNKPVFYAETKGMGSFGLWKADRFLITEGEMRTQVFTYMQQQNLSSLLLVVNSGFELNFDPPMNARRLTEFTGAAVSAERYIIYELKR